MSVDRVNWLNVGLMIATAIAALIAPFRLFLVAFAVLGPLHYLTEISWLHDRDYFLPRAANRRWWLLLVVAAMAAVTFGYVGTEFFHRDVRPTFEMGLVTLTFVVAGAAVYAMYRASVIAMTVAGALFIAIGVQSPRFAIAAYLLVTIVHVLLFTAAFVLFGAVKSGRRSGYISFAVFGLCSAAVMSLSPTLSLDATAPPSYAAFSQLNEVLLSLIGQGGASLLSRAGRRVMQLIAFAYTYHYLNWFSKTSIIRWHEVSKRRFGAIAAGWLAAMALYAYDYRIGFAVSYVLSMAHVLLEFPLNHATFAGLARALGMEWNPTRSRAVSARAR